MKDFPKDLNDWKEYPGMVHWFSPIVLLKTVKKVVTSTIFGQYADRRLVHASLDLVEPEKVIEKCCGGVKGICGEKNEQPIWVDYVADLGDGFDSTYAIAYLIGQKEIQVNNGIKLPRADCLIMGGDQVYPDASQDDYKKRMVRPYEFAFPMNNVKGSSRPVYLIPGNHDWYDGLTLFLAKFCRGPLDPNYLGNWRASQSRSYFAVHLAENWWIWGFDSQLGEDIDKPQAEYFISVAGKMEPNAKVILCASVPSWLKADVAAVDEKERDSYYRSLDYMANILKKNCPGVKVPLVISGDLHHYSRYIAKESGTNFVTAGGGGAFLHPTHHLNDSVRTIWAQTEQTLEIGHDSGVEDTKKTFYPPQEASRRLALGNFGFVYKNWKFCLVIGLLYWICALLMLAWSGYGEFGGTGAFLSRVGNKVINICSTPVFVLLFFAFPLILINAADIKITNRKKVVAIIHALAHLILMVVGTAFVSILVVWLKSVPFGEILYFFALCFGMIFSGFIGGLIWGLYLTIVSWFWGDEANNAFSALRLDSYRHFIRLKIEGDKITIYPIGIDNSPKRDDWKFNESYEPGTQDIPVIVPEKNLEQHLIEDPIVIDINKVTALRL
jgi:hypothetical protein